MESKDVHVKLVERLSFPNPNSERLLRIMRKLVTPEEGRILLQLPAEPAVIARECGVSEEEVRRTLQECVEKGLVIPTSKGPRLVREVIQFHDASLSSSDRWVDTELLDLWKAFYEAEFFPLMEATSRLSADSQVQGVRVVPAWKAIERSSHLSVDGIRLEDNLRDLVRSTDVIAVVPCTCRRSLRRCHHAVENCVVFNRGAEYAVNRGAGRRVSPEEAMALFGEAEEAGLVHTWPFALASRLNEICNCCDDCCIYLDSGLKHGTVSRTLERSHLRAEVDPEICNGCQDCVERCLFEAIEMKKTPQGKKLKATVDVDKCFGCGVCVVGCSLSAMEMKLHRPAA
jgi:Pyruvate/2-oxoacid:ferredoxin oxidoreductase delta subunit